MNGLKRYDIYMYHILYCTNTIYMFNGMLLSHKNECNFSFHRNMGGLGGYYTK